MAEYSREQRNQLSRAIACNKPQNKAKKLYNKYSISPLQKMVAVPGLNDPKRQKDSFLLSHIDWALSTTKGDLVDFNLDSIKVIKDDETLHLVQHGGVGEIGGLKGDEVASIIESGLEKRSYKGSIKISSCFSDVPTAKDKNDSLVDIVRNCLQLRFPNIEVTGYKGPTITNAHTKSGNGGIVTVNPLFLEPISTKGNWSEIDAVLSKYPWGKDAMSIIVKQKDLGEIGLASLLQLFLVQKHKVENTIVTTVTKAVANKRAIDLAPFYEEFISLCDASGFLLK